MARNAGFVAGVMLGGAAAAEPPCDNKDCAAGPRIVVETSPPEIVFRQPSACIVGHKHCGLFKHHHQQAAAPVYMIGGAPAQVSTFAYAPAAATYAAMPMQTFAAPMYAAPSYVMGSMPLAAPSFAAPMTFAAPTAYGAIAPGVAVPNIVTSAEPPASSGLSVAELTSLRLRIQALDARASIALSQALAEQAKTHQLAISTFATKSTTPEGANIQNTPQAVEQQLEIMMRELQRLQQNLKKQ